MAATRPIAVANSASAMPGATTDSEVFCDAAIDWKLVMMPARVPKSPWKAPAEPTVASTNSLRSIGSISRAMATSITFSMRICRPAKERAWPSKLRFHSRMAARKRTAVECSGLAESDLYSSSSDWPDQNACSKWSPALRMRENSMVLSMAMAQTQTEHTRSPTIIDLTIQRACQNKWNSDRLDDVNGATDCAMSPGFMERPFQRAGRPTAKNRNQTRHHDRHSALLPGPKGIRQPLRAH